MRTRSLYKRLYCPRCGNLVYVHKVSARRRRAVCCMKLCDLTSEWVEKSKYYETSPSELIDADGIRATARIAAARKEFEDALKIRMRFQHEQIIR